MKIILGLATTLLLSVSNLRPIENHVKWSYLAKRVSPTEATIYLKATIDEGWHIYSQNIEEGGPTKTEFAFAPSKDYKLTGKTIEPKAVAKFDKFFMMNIASFEKEVIFQQKIKLKPKMAPTVRVRLEFGVCSTKSCLPPDEATFNIPVPLIKP